MARTKDPSQSDSSISQSIQKYIDQTGDYVKVMPIDQERTIHLIAEAKGDGNFRDFAAGAGTTSSSISRIFNGKTIKLGHKIIAGFAAAAESSGAVDLDMLMEAQGRVRKDQIWEFRKKEYRIIRQIIMDELLSGGYNLSEQDEKRWRESRFRFHITEPDKNGEGIQWSFKTLFYPLDHKSKLAVANAYKWLKQVKAKGKNGRESLIIDNEFIFHKIVSELSKVKSDRGFSVILVSIPLRRVVDEFFLSAQDSFEPNGIVSQHRIFEQVKEIQTKKQYMNIPETIIPKLNSDDCRRIIADTLLQKGYQVQYEERNAIIAPFIQIEPDAVMKIRGQGRDPYRWALKYKSFPNQSDNSESLQYIEEWLTKTMAYYFQGGCISRFTLILDNQDVYNIVVDMLKHIMIPSEISILLISPGKNIILDEFILPQKFSKNDLIRLV